MERKGRGQGKRRNEQQGKMFDYEPGIMAPDAPPWKSPAKSKPTFT